MKGGKERKYSEVWFRIGLFFSLLFALAMVYRKPYMKDVFFYGTDGVNQISRFVFIKESIQVGEWPLWNKYLSAGMPAAGNISFGSFYLPSILLSFLPLKLYVYSHYILHLVVGAFFFFLLLRQIGCRRAVAVFMAYVYMFSINLGGMRREHAAIIMATVYLPIILYWIEKYLESRRFLYLGIAAAMMALQFMCGYMQGVLYSDIFVGLYLLIGGIIRKNTGWKKCFQHIAEWFIFYIGLISVQLIPFLELLRENSSFDLPKDTYEFFMQFSLHPVKLLQMMFPQFFGNIYDSIGSQYSSGIDIELYMGPVIVVMLLAGIKIYCKEKRILAYGIGATVIFCWGCMACFPGVAKMISKIPFLGATRIQSRVIFIFCFLVLLMASYIGELVARDNQGTAFSLCVVKNMKHILACVIIISIALLSYAVVQENGDSACEEILNIFRNRFMKDLILMLLTSAVLVLFVYAGKWKKN